MLKHTAAATMPRSTGAPTRAPDRLPYIWLALATVLFAFTTIRWSVAVAAWLAPLFLLRFVRTQRPLPGFLLALLVRFAVIAISLQGILLISGVSYYVLVALIAVLSTLPYLADRLIAPRLTGVVATLVFPLAVTSLEFLGSLGPLGTMDSMANTQYGDLPLMQVVSVTGIWGITFLITWFAAVVNWAWERQFAWPQVRGGALLYAGILGVVLLGGGARLALFAPHATTVRVAGLSASQAAVATFNQQLPAATVSLLASGKATQGDRALARPAFAALDDDLFVRSQQEARAGAKIVVWPEASPTGASVLQEDEPALIQQAGAVARQSGIYLDMGLAVYLPAGGNGPFVKDETVLLDPTGSVAWTYEKTHPAPGEQGVIVLGNGKVPVVSSPFGRLSNVICFDADYPGLVRQAAQGGADLLLVPADDWQAIDPAHAQMAAFRAIESGVSLVRESSKGLSMAVDNEGRVLSTSDYFVTDQQSMVAYVPIDGVRTIYSVVGDLFAWLCLLGFVALTGLAIMQSRRRPSAALADTSVTEPEPVG